MARVEATGPYEVVVEDADRRREATLQHAGAADLVMMGTMRRGKYWEAFGELALAMAQETDVPLVLTGRRSPRAARYGRPGLPET